MVSIKMLVLFFVAWIMASIVLDIIKGYLAKRQQQQMIDAAYLKISKLLSSSIKDLRNSDFLRR